MSEPLMPNTAQNTSNAFRFRSTPLAAMIELKPSRFSVMLASIRIAILVSRKSPMRIMELAPVPYWINGSLDGVWCGKFQESAAGGSAVAGRSSITGAASGIGFSTSTAG